MAAFPDVALILLAILSGRTAGTLGRCSIAAVCWLWDYELTRGAMMAASGVLAAGITSGLIDEQTCAANRDPFKRRGLWKRQRFDIGYRSISCRGSIQRVRIAVGIKSCSRRIFAGT